MKYYLLPIFLIVFICSNLFAQSEFIITTESAIWQEFSGSNAVITAFITITNTGSTDNWYDNFSEFRLKSRNTGNYYKLIDTRKILENDVNPGEFISVSYSFLVPRSADSLMLIYPERYGGKEIFLARSYEISKNKKDFTQESEPYVSENDVTIITGQYPSKNKENSKPTKGDYSTQSENAIFLFPTFGGAGLMKTDKGEKGEYFWQIGYKIPFKIKTFKKQNLNLYADIEFGIMSIQFSKNKSKAFLDFYGLDNSTFVATNDSGRYNPINNWNIYGGIGIEYDKSSIVAPYLSLKAGFNWVNDSYVRIYPTINGPGSYISRAEDLNGPGFQFQFGLTFFKKIFICYNFYSFKAINGNSVLNTTYTGHFINLWLASLIY